MKGSGCGLIQALSFYFLGGIKKYKRISRTNKVGERWHEWEVREMCECVAGKREHNGRRGRPKL